MAGWSAWWKLGSELSGPRQCCTSDSETKKSSIHKFLPKHNDVVIVDLCIGKDRAQNRPVFTVARGIFINHRVARDIVPFCFLHVVRASSAPRCRPEEYNSRLFIRTGRLFILLPLHYPQFDFISTERRTVGRGTTLGLPRKDVLIARSNTAAVFKSPDYISDCHCAIMLLLPSCTCFDRAPVGGWYLV